MYNKSLCSSLVEFVIFLFAVVRIKFLKLEVFEPNFLDGIVSMTHNQ